jgi:hypothetical protein
MTMPTPSPCRWFQFRLRTILIVVGLTAIPLAWIAKERKQSGFEQQLAEQLSKQGRTVILNGPYASWEIYIDRKPQGWLRDAGRLLFGERILGIECIGGSLEDLTPLGELSNLQHLAFVGTPITDLTPLARVKSLKELGVVSTKLSDLSPLAGLTNLHHVNLINTNVSDLSPLSQITSLKSVDVSGAPVSEIEVFRLQLRLPNCMIHKDR